MIIGPSFVWLHFPKCAGTETERILRRCCDGRRDILFDPIDGANVIWHHSLAQREAYDPAFRVGAREVICGFRRLPSWLLSRVHYEQSRTPEASVTRAMLLRGEFFEQTSAVNRADGYMQKYSDRVSAWVRTEHLEEDIIEIFSRHHDLRGIDLQAAFRYENANPFPYIADPAFWFTPDELDGLYRANPIWAGLEQKVYGSLLAS